MFQSFPQINIMKLNLLMMNSRMRKTLKRVSYGPMRVVMFIDNCQYRIQKKKSNANIDPARCGNSGIQKG